VLRARAITLILVVSSHAVWAQDFEAALEQARELAAEHRYRDVIEIMGAFDDLSDPEARYVQAAEIGRAYFHLGNYSAADTAFREAVSLRPQRAESALYLHATSYILGNREQAYAIFREIIASGATDLFLAVTLPGERLFLADPTVWSILDELDRSVDVDLDRGALLGVEIGLSRAEVERRLGATAASPGEALTARAGPNLTWVFAFDDSGALNRIMLHNENLYRYTPYRLRFSDLLDWRSTPAAATRSLGAPMSTATAGDDHVVMVWDRETVRITFEFAPPRSPAPPGMAPDGAVLRVARIEAAAADADDPAPDLSASMNQ
jgi:tetratricopeptide (TPR) repeat protein